MQADLIILLRQKQCLMPKIFLKKKKIFSRKYKNKIYISLDIITANFTAIKFFDPELVLGFANWKELIKSFTDIEYFIQSKHFRQIVFDRFSSTMKRVTSIQKYLTNYLYQILKSQNIPLEGASHDEIIISSDKDTLKSHIEKINICLNELPKNMQNIWKVVPFELSSICNTPSYVKKILDPITLEIPENSKLKIQIRIFMHKFINI